MDEKHEDEVWKRNALVWDEYRYRHEHIWKLVFQLTGAAVLLGTVPYLDTGIGMPFRWWLLAPPVLAIALILFAMLRLHRELLALKQVKVFHRKQQLSYGIKGNVGRGTFDLHVWVYLSVLMFLAATNVLLGALYLCQAA